MLSGVKMRVLVILSIFLFIQVSQGNNEDEDICICCGIDILQQNKDNCSILLTPITDDDLVMLQKLCVKDQTNGWTDSTGQFHRDAYPSYMSIKPYLSVEGWKISPLEDFYFEDCKKDLDDLSKMLFWIKNTNSTDLDTKINEGFLARKIMNTGTDEIISQLGMYYKSIGRNSYLREEFIPYEIDGVPDISSFPGYYQYLIRRMPVSYEVKDPQKIAKFSKEIQEEHLGVFTYYNPSNYPQKFSIEMAFPSDVLYETEEYLVLERPLKYIGPNETLQLKTGEFLTQTVNYTVTFNITVKPHRTVSAKVVGVWTRYDTKFTATLNTTFLKLGNYIESDIKHNVTGKKINISFGRFYLKDIQEYHSNEVIILSYSAISGILFGLAFLLCLVLLFYIVRRIKKCCRKTPSSEGYTVLND